MIIDVDDFDVNLVRIERLKAPRGNPKGRKVHYSTNIAAFDIETTRLPDMDQSIMYIWQMQIDEYTIIGRYWYQFYDLLLRLKERLNGLYMVLWVHSLSYEFQFLKGRYEFEEDEVFCTDNRKVLKCTMFDSFEFRCSYLHSNMSLAKFIDAVGAKTKKLDGKLFDYSKVRYPWTPLNDYEIEYCINDVKGLTEAIRTEMEKDGDTLYTIPLTSTGYVRRDCKKAMKEYNNLQLKALLPDAYIYTMLREAYRGGNTHANRFYADQIVENVNSVDESSAYPSALLNRMYPMRPWYHEGAVTPDRLRYLLDKRRRKAIVMRIAFWDLKLRNPFDGCPYLSRDKCRHIEKGVYDNGRILSCDYMETTITDIDFRLIQTHYTWSGSNAYDVAYSRYEPLPEPYRRTIEDYYKKKTSLKGVDDYFYGKAKSKLNGLYGLSSQDPCKLSIIFRNGQYEIEEVSVEDLIEKNNKKAFLSYAWGVFCTAHARAALQLAIDAAGDNFVYCDTDSVKYIGDLDLEAINTEIRNRSEKNGAYADDPRGKRHYMGVFEYENHSPRFCTLGAKKYAYEDDNGGLHITIAGVNKKEGAKEMERLENMREGFTFRKAGGTESIYNDGIDQIITVEGNPIRITDNVVIKDSTYTLGLTAEYKALLEGCVEIKYSPEDLPGLYKQAKFTKK